MGMLLPKTKELLEKFFLTPFEIRAIKDNGKTKRVFNTVRNDWSSGWQNTRGSIADINRTANIFITLNPLSEQVFEKAKNKNGNLKTAKNGYGIKDSDIDFYRWLLIDIDPVRNADSQSVSSTDEEKENAREISEKVVDFLRRNGFCDPVICDSGNGYHLHYRISLPNDIEIRSLIKQFLFVISKKFSTEKAKIDTTVFNPARIIKLYGTVARKGENTQERPHRKSGFISFPLGAEIKVNTKDLIEKISGPVEVKETIEIADESKQKERIEWVREFMDTHGIPYWEEMNPSGEMKFYFNDGCPFDPTHKNKDAYICVFNSGKTIFKCLHDSCSEYGWHDFVKLYDPSHSSSEDRSEKLKKEVEELLGQETKTADEQHSGQEKVTLEIGKKGVVQSMANLRKALSEDVNLRGLFGINELTGCPENRKTGEEWRDVDDVKVYEYLETVYGLNKWDSCLRAIGLQHEAKKFNPVRDKLESLIWDKKPRIETSLIDYLDAEDSTYTRSIALLMFLGAVMRIYEPGSKFDNMIVLLGPQGCGKSTFVRRMALEDKFFSDSIRGVGDREGAEQLRGAWIVEWGEMSAMKRARDAETIKLFISQQYDRYRPSYGRYVRTFPRMCIFIGTTNDQDFLSDRTGNRRFFPVVVKKGKKDIWSKDSIHDFEQMMAEAVYRYKNGERPESTEETERQADIYRGMCVEEDTREGVIKEWLDAHPEVNITCTRVIWYYALRESEKPMTMKDSREIGRILDTFKGWSRENTKFKFGANGDQRAWRKDKSAWSNPVWLPENNS